MSLRSGFYCGMQNSKRQIVFASVLAMFLYLVPNLVQDTHRISGHQTRFAESPVLPGIQLSQSKEKCPICVFEFNIVEGIVNFAYIPVIKVETFVLAVFQENQIQNKIFHYYDLRAPPKA